MANVGTAMPRAPLRAIAATRRLFFATLVVIAVAFLLGLLTWPSEPWRTIAVVIGFTSYLFAALFGLLLAGQRWPALGDFTQFHGWVVVAVIMASAAAMMGYVAYPDPVSLLIGPIVLGFFILIGWGVRKVHLFGL